MHPTRIFKSSNDFLTAWNEYKQDLKEKSEEWFKVQYVGKEGTRKTDAYKLPLTAEGFYRFCFDNYGGGVKQYFENKSDLYTDFIEVCSRIKNEIRENQIIGGMLGVYNPSITQRLNSLVEKNETELKGGLNIPKLPDIGNR